MANPTLTRRVIDGLVAVAFLAIGWISSGALTVRDPSYTYTPRGWLFVLLPVLATVPYAWRRRWPTAAFLIGLFSTTTLWLLGYNAGVLPLILLFGGYFVAVARPTREVVACTAASLGCFGLLWWTPSGAPFGAPEAFTSALAVAIVLAFGRTGRLRVDLAEARAQAAEEAARRRSTRGAAADRAASCTTSSVTPSAPSRSRRVWASI